MTSPVAPGPVPNIDLTLHWATENELVEASIAAILVRLPEWVPVEGNTEVVLLEGFALQTAQEVFTINQLPRQVFEAVLEINGVVRQPGIAAKAQMFVTTSSGLTGTLTLPKGARFRAVLPDGTTADFLSDSAQNVPSGAVDYVVWTTAEQVGTRPHAIQPGDPVQTVGVPTWVETVRIGTAGVHGGVDTESNQDFWTRGAAILRRRPSALVVAQHFADAALDFVEVGRAAAWDRWDGTGGAAGIGTDLGHITVAVAGNVGQALSAAVMEKVRAGLAAQAQAGLTIHVIPPTYAAVTVTTTVVADAGVNAAALKAGIEADLKVYLSPATWPFGTTITTNALVVRIGRFPGVAAVTAVGGTNLTGPGANPFNLPAANPTVTATVTV